MTVTPYEILDFGQVQVQVQVGPVTAAGLRAFLDGETQRIRAAIRASAPQAPRKGVVILDASVSLMPPADARQVQAAWLKENQHLLGLVTYKIGLVLPNPLLRAFMASVLALAPQPVPMNTHSALAPAVHWAIAAVSEIGGVVSDALRADGVAAVENAKAKVLSR